MRSTLAPALEAVPEVWSSLVAGKMIVKWPKPELTGTARLAALKLNKALVCESLRVWATAATTPKAQGFRCPSASLDLVAVQLAGVGQEGNQSPLRWPGHQALHKGESLLVSMPPGTGCERRRRIPCGGCGSTPRLHDSGNSKLQLHVSTSCGRQLRRRFGSPHDPPYLGFAEIMFKLVCPR